MTLTELSEQITLKMTCGACPEQYDAYFGDEVVGYLRLRHGHFSVSYKGPGGEEVFSASPEGDGMFEDHEQEYYLEAAKLALAMKHREVISN